MNKQHQKKHPKPVLIIIIHLISFNVGLLKLSSNLEWPYSYCSSWNNTSKRIKWILISICASKTGCPILWSLSLWRFQNASNCKVGETKNAVDFFRGNRDARPKKLGYTSKKEASFWRFFFYETRKKTGWRRFRWALGFKFRLGHRSFLSG